MVLQNLQVLNTSPLALVDRENEQVLSILQPVVQTIKSFTATKMTRVLLTGGSGFIATHILRLLLERG